MEGFLIIIIVNHIMSFNFNVNKNIAVNDSIYMGVSKNSGTPKWMVKKMENPINMDDLGVPLFSETSIYVLFTFIPILDCFGSYQVSSSISEHIIFPYTFSNHLSTYKLGRIEPL